jgi:polyhydroxyalkanoate synthase subunit PhaC
MADRDQGITYYPFVETQKKLIVNGSQMLYQYWLAYTLSFRRTLSSFLLPNDDRYFFNLKNTGNEVYFRRLHEYYNNWLKYTDALFSERLRSDEFLASLRKYQDGVIDASRHAKKMGYFSALSLLDDYIDTSLKRLSSVSESSIFISTPYEIVQKREDTRLLRYYNYYTQEEKEEEQKEEEKQLQLKQTLTSKRKLKYKTPLLMVYAPINRYHILDLIPERSIVNQFVSSGFDVFLLDWGEQKNNRSTIADYINYIDEYIQKIKKITNSDKVSLFGYSWGGILSIMYSSLDNNNSLKNLIVQSSQIDFDKDKTTIAEWMRSFPAEKFVEEFGEMHGHIIDLAFLMRNPLKHGFDNVKFALAMQNKNNRRDESINIDPYASFLKFIQALLRITIWLNNTPDIQGELFREFAKKMYQQNLLIKGQISVHENAFRNENESTRVSSKIVDLKKITIPVLDIVATQDDLVQPVSCIPLSDFISSTDKELIQFPSGHVELCISSDSHNNLWPHVAKWLQERCS